MDTAGSFLLLFIFAAVIFGAPLLLLAIRLIETISEWREIMGRAEDKSPAEEKTPIEKNAPDDAGEWTPARRMR